MREEQCAAILAALDDLGAIQAELASLSARRADRRRHDLIAQRRALAAETAKVGELADALFQEIGDEAMTAGYRRLLSALRSKAAMHHANWSAVRVGELEPEYLASARATGAAHRAFIDWLRAAIADITTR